MELQSVRSGMNAEISSEAKLRGGALIVPSQSLGFNVFGNGQLQIEASGLRIVVCHQLYHGEPVVYLIGKLVAA